MKSYEEGRTSDRTMGSNRKWSIAGYLELWLLPFDGSFWIIMWSPSVWKPAVYRARSQAFVCIRQSHLKAGSLLGGPWLRVCISNMFPAAAAAATAKTTL